MNNGERLHLEFLQVLEDKRMIENIKESSKDFISELDYSLKNLSIYDATQVSLLNLLLIEGRSNYFINYNDH